MAKNDVGIDAVNRLAKRVIAYRAEHNESMTHFAKGAGVSIETIKKLEQFQCNPLINTVWHIANYMGLTLDEAMGPLPEEEGQIDAQ
ncbi:MAG: helix-turn-helix domain-containing protein [Ruminococcus flavefaciens]|nr:helix-turn-helix domain-containing protein [Ruminococcus flavefaciens]